jgi:retinol dehydrogenase 13
LSERRTALVTGASAGMGLATAIALLRDGFRVIMLCRDERRGREALAAALAAAGEGAAARAGSAAAPAAAELLLCDLADLADLRRAAASFLARGLPLDVLVNNAGVITMDRRETREGFELQFGVNHLAHFLLTSLLRDAIVAAPAGRVVVVSSGAHRIGRINLEDPNLKRGYSAFRAYSQSKLANVLFASELARALEGTRATANSCHPGAVATSMGVDRVTGFGGGITALLRPFFLTSEEGARTAVWLAASPEAAGLNGAYCYRCRPVPPSRLAQDSSLAAELWDLSERMTAGRG